MNNFVLLSQIIANFLLSQSFPPLLLDLQEDGRIHDALGTPEK